jgi:hypothetical protein
VPQTRSPLLPVVVLSLLLALGPSACGDDNAPESTIPGNADPAAVAVIDDWSTKLRNGDVEAAAAMFAIPSVAENGPTIAIDDLDDARLFNESLPCGAQLVRAEADGELVVATFRLTERPGPGSCGSGAGATAQTAFLIEEGKIVEWRRVGEGGLRGPSSSI